MILRSIVGLSHMGWIDRSPHPARLCAVAQEARRPPHKGEVKFDSARSIGPYAIALRSISIAFLSLGLLSCGVKSNLDLPSGAMADKSQQDPSKPPKPLGESGGTTLPYPTGP